MARSSPSSTRTTHSASSTAGLIGALSVREAARRLGVADQTIRRAIRRGQLEARKESGAYSVSQEALERYRSSRSRRRATATVSANPVSLGADSNRLLQPQSPPSPLTSLIGRDRECVAVTTLLRRSDIRLLTLTGPGGVGKSRLALAVVDSVAGDFADGVAFVDLAAVATADLFGTTLAQALRIRTAGRRPIASVLIKQLRQRELLLVLDNFEHLLAAAPFVSHLLAACPRLTILVTSRIPLRIDGEHVFATPPLGVPTSPGSGDESAAVSVERSEAGRLFVARAAAARQDFMLTDANAPAIAEICRRLDGLPLGIELAASRCAAFSPQLLLSRMDQRLPLLSEGRRDAPPRMRSLRQAIAWSHDLLSPVERVAFRRLAVFAGGFTLAAAEALLAEADEQVEHRETPTAAVTPLVTLDVAASLHDQNLLTRDEQTDGSVRLRMLETIREFAYEELRASGEETAVRDRHADYFAAMVERADRAVPRPDRWWISFETEWGNLRAALSWAIASGRSELGLRLGGELFGYWMLRGQVSEGIAWLERLLALGADEPAAPQSRAVMALGFLYWIAGELERARAYAARASALASSVDDTIAVAACHFLQGFLAETEGDLAAAAADLTAARGLYKAASLETAAAAAAAHLGRIVGRQGDPVTAKAVLVASIAVLDEDDGGIWGAALAKSDLALLVAREGDLAGAAKLVTRALRQHLAIGDELAVLISLTVAAWIGAAAGRSQAARLLGAVAALREQCGPSIWSVARPVYDHACLVASGQQGESRFRSLFDDGERQEPASMIEAAIATLEQIAAGAGPVAPPPTPVDLPPLSPRELAVMRLVSAGHTDQEVAAALGLKVRTINTYVANARRKLAAPSRTAAVAEMARRGLV